jgi:hypothetical protein
MTIYSPNEVRTRVSGVRGQRPRPLDDGTSVMNSSRKTFLFPAKYNPLSNARAKEILLYIEFKVDYNLCVIYNGMY